MVNSKCFVHIAKIALFIDLPNTSILRTLCTLRAVFILNLYGSESNSDNPRSKPKLRGIQCNRVPRSVSNYRLFPSASIESIVGSRAQSGKRHSRSRRRAEDFGDANGWTFGIVYELRLTRSCQNDPLLSSFPSLSPLSLSLPLSLD